MSHRWIGWTAAGALAVGAIATGIVAAGAASDFNDARDTLGTSRSAIEDAQSKTRLWTAVTLGLGAAAVTVATITIVGGQPSQRAAKASVGVGTAGLRLAGTF